MDERIERIIRNTESFEALSRFEANARQRKAITDEISDAIRKRSGDLGRQLISERTGLNLTDLSPAEGKIVEAVSEYVGVMKRQGKDATRTLAQLRNRGLIQAAEIAVAKSKPTQGFQTLSDEGREDLSYEQIILDHEEEFSQRAIWYARRTLGLSNDSPKAPAQNTSLTQGWTEGLIHWLGARAAANGGKIPQFANADTAVALGIPDLHKHGRVLGNVQSRTDFACYRAGLPPLGLAADAPFDRAWGRDDRDWDFPIPQMQAAAQSRVWTPEDFAAVIFEAERLSGQAHIPWKEELSTNEAAVKAWAFGLAGSGAPRAPAEPNDAKAEAAQPGDAASDEAPYWIFVCNPKRWAIDRSLDRHIEEDSWGVRKSDQDRFAPGQLGIIRVGVDQRTITKRGGKPRLESGIYALCEVDSTWFPATGAADEFWAEEAAREPGWPTVKIRYLRTYLDNPLTIARLRSEAPEISRLLLDGFQASSFPISADDFRVVLRLLREDAEDIPASRIEEDINAAGLAALEAKYLHASPEVKERLSKSVERGSIGAFIKKANGYRCQVCEALGREPLGFTKKDGRPYVEAHHVTPVALQQIGTLAASNVVTVCANHHRELHYGQVSVQIKPTTFEFGIAGVPLSVPRLGLEPFDMSSKNDC